MEKGYFPTSLIKFQVETNKTDLSDLNNKNIKINNRDYIIRKYTEKPRQDYRYRYANFAEKPRRYVKPHPSTRYIKETAEKTNIEQYTNNQNTLTENLADITRRLELIEEEILKLKKTLHALKQERKSLKETEKDTKSLETNLKRYFDYTTKNNELKESHIDYIARQLTIRLDLDIKETKRARSVIDRCFDKIKLGTIIRPETTDNKS